MTAAQKNQEGKMSEELEKKTDEAQGEETEDKTESEEKVITSPSEQLKELCRGKLKLMYPMRAHGEDVTEIRFDFCSLTGAEMMDALDNVPTINNMFGISNKQALLLFAATAEKCAPMVDAGGKMTRQYDAKDVRDRLSATDAVKALQIAKLFYNASSQAGNKNISKD